MQFGRPSRTALGAAGHRAAHQVLESGRIFSDPLAVPILGAEWEAILQDAERDPSRRGLRLFIAVRTRFAEDAVAEAVEHGLRQLVVLGAGLDTFAYRNPFAALRVFEVDHPATQAWKRERLAETGIAEPQTLTFAPIDFERDTLAEGLAAAGCDRTQRTFFTWLGVVPYLTEHAVFETLGEIACAGGGAHVVFDYGNPSAPGLDSSVDAAAQEALAERVATAGEPFQSFFETNALHARMRAIGFREIEDLGRASIRERYFGAQTRSGSDRGGHIIRATTT